MCVDLARFKSYAGFVKLEHTVFSLPLIYAGAVIGAEGLPSLRRAGWILLAAVGGRVMAMGLNRLIDARIDARNPRTQNRELPRGAMRRGEAWAIVWVAGLLYALSAAKLSPWCLKLAPIPVALFVLYPYLKRFTVIAHLGLGLAWSMAPLGGWLGASAAALSLAEVGWLWGFSILWVTGFDIIYATLDLAFDRQEGLHSLPAKIGKAPALRVAALLHVAAFLALVILQRDVLRSPAGRPWLLAIGALFVWQHLITPRKPEFAFFQLNGIIGLLVFEFVLFGYGGG